MRGIGTAGLCVAVLAGAAFAADGGCKDNPGLTGACYWVHGTVALSADRGFVLFGYGRHRSLIVRNPPYSKHDLPANLLGAIDQAQRTSGLAGAEVRGVFLVCPIPPDQAGENVCIQTAIRLKTPKSQAASKP
jgi:hypothetical protein